MKNRLFVIAMVILLFIGTRISAGAQTGSNFADLKLQITAMKEQYLQLEPVTIILKLSNNTDQPILGHNALDLSYSQIELFTYHNGKKQEIKNLSAQIKHSKVENEII